VGYNSIGTLVHGVISVLVKCYECFGHKFTGNLKCAICDGKGTLDTDKICQCGRPVCRERNNIGICWTLTCELRVTAKPVPVSSSTQVPFGWGDDDMMYGPPDILRMY
jgi:hypothetical protein